MLLSLRFISPACLKSNLELLKNHQLTPKLLIKKSEIFIKSEKISFNLNLYLYLPYLFALIYEIRLIVYLIF